MARKGEAATEVQNIHQGMLLQTRGRGVNVPNRPSATPMEITMQIKRFAATATISVTAMMITVLPAIPADLLGMCRDLEREIISAEGGAHLDLQISTCTAAIEAHGSDGKATSAVLYGARATGYVLKGQYDRALADYNLSIRYLPDYVPSIYNRGLLKKKIGDTAGADADFARVRQLRPGYLERLEGK